ncbi:MAG TPA: TlpA disulfide reductase family protein, partial [Burkholderiaceae bacterium]|nr:TlpA disulfide reductase family protein [Burkholderiaceae bacterium]
MTRSAFIRFATLILVLALVGALVVKTVARRNAEASAAERLYARSFDDAEGHLQALSQWRGQYLVVNFWATWCAPCVAEMPELDRLQRQFAGRNVAIVGIGIEGEQQVREFRDRLGLRLTLLAGGYDALSLARDFGDVQGVLPYTVLLSTKGEVLHSRAGALQSGQMQAWLTDLQ